MRPVTNAVVLSFITITLACGERHEHVRSDLNLLVITLDTTRADRLPAYGFTGVQTPNIDRLAREGVVFEQTSSAAPLTLPAHCSLFTGRFPFGHGVRDNGQPLGAQEVTLAALLHTRGFHTGAFVGAYVLDGRWGLNRGFDQYVDDFQSSARDAINDRGLRHPANEVVDAALTWLHASAVPFFTWIHLYDAHAPYDPPEPYRSLYRDEPYLGAIAFIDSQIGRVLSQLESRHVLDRTVIAVVADHGESLGDHGEPSHGLFVYESVIRVPLIIRAPLSGVGHHRIHEPTRSVDLLPTVLDMLGTSPSPSSIDGVSLLPMMRGQAHDLGLEAYSETEYPLNHFGWSALMSLRRDRFKLVEAPKPELYDLDTDPGELRNLYAERPALADRMQRRLKVLRSESSRRTVSQSDTLSVSHRPDERLAGLGYVTGAEGARLPAAYGAALADPKDKLDLYNLIIHRREAIHLLHPARSSGSRSQQ